MADNNQDGRIALGPVSLDVDNGTLSRDGETLELRAKSFALLCHLARNRGRVVTKAELLDTIWPDVTVTEDSLTQTIRDIRRALGPDASDMIRTVPRRGYMLAEATDLAESGLRTSRDLPRIAILPFADQTGQPELSARIEFVNDGIGMGLARFRTLTVIARHSVESAVEDAGRDLVRVGEKLRADYLVDGTARPGPNGPVLALRLNDCADGSMVWAEIFDCSGDAILTLQDDATVRIVGQLASALLIEGRSSSVERPTSNVTAFDHYAKAMALMRRADPALIDESRVHLEQAIAVDPGFGLAWSWLAWAELAQHGYGLASDEVRQRARTYAQRGVEIAPAEPRTLAALGYVQSFTGEYEAAEANISQSLRLNPSSADSLHDMAILMLVRCRPAETLNCLARLDEIQPIRSGHYYVIQFEALYQLRRYEEAAQAMARVAHPDLRQRVWAAAIAAQLGRDDDVRRHLGAVAAEAPDWDHLAAAERSYTYEHPGEREHMLDGIRMALAIWRKG